MTTKLKLVCDGQCGAEIESRHFRREFHGVTGKPWGFGRWQTDTPNDVCPDGWQWMDPYTGCTYCPECWAEIEREPTESEQGLVPIPDGYAEQ